MIFPILMFYYSDLLANYNFERIAAERLINKIITKNQYQILALYYLIFGLLSDIVRPPLIGCLQGDLYNM
jgi:hypothetical protein